MHFKYFLFILYVLAAAGAGAQEIPVLIQEGNGLYRQGQYDKAERKYMEALKREPGNAAARFNLAATRYRLGKQEESIRTYDEMAMKTEDAQLRSRLSYNKGAILSRQKKLEESIEAYKQALRLDPADKEARENLQKALLELKKKQPPPKKDQDKKPQKQKQKQQPKMNKKEAEQRLKLLEQKEKEVQERLQKSKNGTGSQTKDW